MSQFGILVAVTPIKKYKLVNHSLTDANSQAMPFLTCLSGQKMQKIYYIFNVWFSTIRLIAYISANLHFHNTASLTLKSNKRLFLSLLADIMYILC